MLGRVFGLGVNWVTIIRYSLIDDFNLVYSEQYSACCCCCCQSVDSYYNSIIECIFGSKGTWWD